MPLRCLLVPDWRTPQLSPSMDVMIVPYEPTATNWPLPYADLERVGRGTGLRRVHVSNACAWPASVEISRASIALSLRAFMVSCSGCLVELAGQKKSVKEIYSQLGLVTADVRGKNDWNRRRSAGR